MNAALLGPWDVTLGGLVLLAVVLLALVYFGREARFRKVRFGFFIERETEEDLGLKDAPPEVRRWLARFFERYPWKQYVPPEEGSMSSPDDAPTEPRSKRGGDPP